MQSRKISVMELCTSPDLGGLELSMINTTKLLVIDFNVVAIVTKDSKISTYYDDSIDCIELQNRSKLNFLNRVKTLSKIIDDKKIQIIHFHWTKDILLVVLAKILSKTKPKIVQTRHMTMTRFKDDFYHKFLYKNLSLILAVSQQVKEQLEKYIPDEIRPHVELLYAGVSKKDLLINEDADLLKKTLSFSPSSFNIGMVGRINQPKGQYLLIDAVEILKNKGLDVKAYFVGNPMQKEYLESLKDSVENRGLQSCINFLGFMKNPHHFYQICDTIVLASKKETFGLVLVEAMGMNTAIIGSNSGGVTEIIEDKKTGLLFEAENADDLAQKIEFMMLEKNLQERMQKEAIIKCNREFDEEKQYTKLKKIFEELI